MDKIMGIVRTAVAVASGAMIGLGVDAGGDVQTILTNVETIVGSVGAIAVAGASIYAKTKGVGILGRLFGRK